MTSHGSKNPTSWDEYQYGTYPRHTSESSVTRSIHFDEEAARGQGHTSAQDGERGHSLRRRRSSISASLEAIKTAGGVNSIENFARSWQRAVGFHELAPQTHNYSRSNDEAVEGGEDVQARDSQEAGASKSLLRDQLASEGAGFGHEVAAEQHGESEVVNTQVSSTGTTKQAEIRAGEEDNILSIAPHLASPFGASYGTSYGSLSTRANESSMVHAAKLWRQTVERGVQPPDKEREPLLVKRVEREDGKVVNVVIGQSTLPQTVFNSVNVLIGVGLLGLPLGIKYSGWLIGMSYFLFSALITSYTAKILAKCLDVDDSLITFGDLAYISFGPRARILVSLLFSLEPITANVALVVVFADSLDALIPGLGVVGWKVICAVILIPLGFLPLRILSFTSVLGIVSCFGIVTIVFIDGFLKPHTPGSLREPAKIYLWPSDWSMLPIAFGMLMSPWGGHSVFPNIYRDMRHPQKYTKGLTITYIFTFLLELSIAVAGILMFGDGVQEIITSNILLTGDYPKALSICMTVFIAIIPLTKIPLNARPIVSTIEILTGVDVRTVSTNSALVGMSGLTRGFLKFTIRALTMIIFVVIAILFPSFDRIMALLGSALCFTICVILPLAFHLRIFRDKISVKQRTLDYVLIVISSIFAVVGTVWALLPRKVFTF